MAWFDHRISFSSLSRRQTTARAPEVKAASAQGHKPGYNHFVINIIIHQYIMIYHGNTYKVSMVVSLDSNLTVCATEEALNPGSLAAAFGEQLKPRASQSLGLA